MGDQSVRQEARRAALEVRTRQRRERAERDKRIEDLVVHVVIALRERDEAEQRAARAIRAMMAEGLTTHGVLTWCAGELTTRDLARIRQVTTPSEAGRVLGAGVDPESGPGEAELTSDSGGGGAERPGGEAGPSDAATAGGSGGTERERPAS